MGYLNGILVLLLVLVISDHVYSFELVDSSSNEETGASQGQLDSPTPTISKETPTVVILEKPRHDLETNTLNHQEQGPNDTRSSPEFFPFAKLVLKPVFHIKRVAKINDNTENKNEGPRFVACNKASHFLDMSGKRTLVRPLVHRSIFITKLINPKGNAMPRPNHYFGRFNPISSVDPTLGILDRMMNDLMLPLLNEMPLLENPNMRPLQNGEDSSLKFWMQNENRNKPNPWNKGDNPFEGTDENVSGEDVGNNNESTSEEDSDYKADLWKKFMNDDNTNKQDGIDGTSVDKQNTCQNCQSCENNDGKINDENIEKEDETEWWSRLVMPWKRPIYKDHKKSSHQEKRMSPANPEILDSLDEDEKDRSVTGFNTRAVGLRGSEALPLKDEMNLSRKRSKLMEGNGQTHTRGKRIYRNVNVDAIIILFSFGLMIVLMFKIIRFVSKIRAQNMATTSGNPIVSLGRKLRVPLPSYSPPPSYYTTASPHGMPVPHL